MGFPAANSLSDKNHSVDELRKEVSHALEQRLTGLAKFCFSSGEELTLIVNRGSLRQAYYKDGSISKGCVSFE